MFLSNVYYTNPWFFFYGNLPVSFFQFWAKRWREFEFQRRTLVYFKLPSERATIHDGRLTATCRGVEYEFWQKIFRKLYVNSKENVDSKCCGEVEGNLNSNFTKIHAVTPFLSVSDERLSMNGAGVNASDLLGVLFNKKGSTIIYNTCKRWEILNKICYIQQQLLLFAIFRII